MMSDKDYREPWYCPVCGQTESSLPCQCEMEDAKKKEQLNDQE